MVEGSEGDVGFLNPPRAGEGGVPDVEGSSCIGAVSTFSCVTALIATEDDVAFCGRAETELEVDFGFFTRGSIEPSEFDTWTFVRDPETGVEGADRRGTCVEATGSRGICDSTGPETVEGVF